jgi:two-component system chemotaxis sensor kinase CheA
VTDALFACLDTLQEMVDRVASGDTSDLDTTELLGRLEAVAGEAGDVPAAPGTPAPQSAGAGAMTDYERIIVRQAAEQGLHVIEATVELEPGCVLRAARAFMVATELEALGDIVRSEPTTEQIERDEIGERLVFWVATTTEPAGVEAAVTRVS